MAYCLFRLTKILCFHLEAQDFFVLAEQMIDAAGHWLYYAFHF